MAVQYLYAKRHLTHNLDPTEAVQLFRFFFFSFLAKVKAKEKSVLISYKYNPVRVKFIVASSHSSSSRHLSPPDGDTANTRRPSSLSRPSVLAVSRVRNGEGAPSSGGKKCRDLPARQADAQGVAQRLVGHGEEEEVFFPPIQRTFSFFFYFFF